MRDLTEWRLSSKLWNLSERHHDMPRVLLINQGHTSNLGDVAINTVITTFLKNHDIDVICRPFEERVEYFSFLPLPIRLFVGKCILHIEAIIDLLNTLRIRRYLKTVSASAAVIGGGELLIGQHPGLNSAFFCWTRELHKRGIPIVVVGVSRDSTRHPRFDSRYIQALEKCSYISVRDHSTQNFLQDAFHIRDVQYAPDVVFSYRSIASEDTSVQYKRDLTLCVPMAYSVSLSTFLGVASEDEYFDYILRLITQHTSPTARVAFTTTTREDVDTANRLARYATEHGLDARYIDAPSLTSFIALLSKTQLVVSCRMHACILGLEYDCKVVPIPIFEKLSVFQKEYADGYDAGNTSALSLQQLEKLIELLAAYQTRVEKRS